MVRALSHHAVGKAAAESRRCPVCDRSGALTNRVDDSGRRLCRWEASGRCPEPPPPSLDELLDSDGAWELRANIYRNGKLVGYTDVLASAYGDLGWNIGCALDERTVTEPIRKTRKHVR